MFPNWQVGNQQRRLKKNDHKEKNKQKRVTRKTDRKPVGCGVLKTKWNMYIKDGLICCIQSLRKVRWGWELNTGFSNMEVTGDLGTGKCSRAVRAKGYFEVPEEEKEKKEMQINITKRNFSLPLNRPKEVKRLTMPSATERKGTRYTSFCSRPKPQAPKKLETHLPFDPPPPLSCPRDSDRKTCFRKGALA